MPLIIIDNNSEMQLGQYNDVIRLTYLRTSCPCNVTLMWDCVCLAFSRLVFFNQFKCYIMRYYVWAFYAKFSHRCFQPIPFGSVFTRSIFVGSL